LRRRKDGGKERKDKGLRKRKCGGSLLERMKEKRWRRRDDIERTGSKGLWDGIDE
jgi:hypothetical protein